MYYILYIYICFCWSEW